MSGFQFRSAPATSSSLFGSATAPTTGITLVSAIANPSLFSSSPFPLSFAQSSSPNTTSAAAPSNGFGTSSAPSLLGSTAAGSSLFGTPPGAAPRTGSSLFGGGSLFGSTAASPFATTGSAASTATTPPGFSAAFSSSSSPFATSSATTSLFGSSWTPSLFGSTASAGLSFGTTATPPAAAPSSGFSFSTISSLSSAFNSGSCFATFSGFGTTQSSTTPAPASQPALSGFGTTHSATSPTPASQPAFSGFGTTQPSSSAAPSSGFSFSTLSSLSSASTAAAASQPSFSGFGTTQSSTTPAPASQPAFSCFGTTQPSTSPAPASQSAFSGFGNLSGAASSAKPTSTLFLTITTAASTSTPADAASSAVSPSSFTMAPLASGSAASSSGGFGTSLSSGATASSVTFPSFSSSSVATATTNVAPATSSARSFTGFVVSSTATFALAGFFMGFGVATAASTSSASTSVAGTSSAFSAPLTSSSLQIKSTPTPAFNVVFNSPYVEASRRRVTSSSSPDEAYALSTPRSRSNAEGSFDEFIEFSRNVSQNSAFSSCSSSVANDETIEDPLFHHLKKAMAEAVNSRRKAFEEAARREKAERDAVEAIHKAEALESLYAEETRQRKEIEEALSKEKEELENLKNDKDGIVEELQNALNQKLSLEKNIISMVELLQNHKKERDDLLLERDNALKEAEELRKCRTRASSSVHQPQFFSECSFSEIEEATKNFDPCLKIGEGGYSSVYRGVLRHTPVAIKVLHSDSMQGPKEFQQEVAVLSKVRHPYVVTLIGACPEACALVYEYLPNGSLEDRLSCRDSSPPLSWQTRIRIATELCYTLVFLHSNKQHSIVHGDLKPDNILLDANLVSKLSDFRICRPLYHPGSSTDNTTSLQTGPKGNFIYMDPEFLSSGELTSTSDVYSFGITLLRLLTGGRSPFELIKDVQCAFDKGELKDVMDPLAGDWPFVLAKQLAYLALRCCEMSRKNRPDLASEVWSVLETMKASCGGSPCFSHGSDEHRQPPQYFICPIFQEVMRDPQVAADGFTYEAVALRRWLDSRHDTSPMTNLRLAHRNLVPNRALRSAIQEWLPQQNP